MTRRARWHQRYVAAGPWRLHVPGRPSQTGAMDFYREQILPRLTDLALRGTEAARLRARATAGLSGEVLEVGFGSGLTMPCYPPAVTRVLAVEPSAVARKLAAGRVAASAAPVDYIGADAQALPLEDATVDHVVSILTLCTIPCAERALTEICRVLRPGGAFHFAEHGLSPQETVARWQHRLTPLQRRVFGGCHIDRPIGQMVADAGLELIRLDNYYLKGPHPFGYMFDGVAAKPGGQ
jgi:ubiquinone/menaquinone biosynthesis C-methylase UbiE